MNIFEKYELYRNIIKQKPYFTVGYCDKKNCDMFFLHYSTDDYQVGVFFDTKIKKYTATAMQHKKGLKGLAYFESSFFAKKLFNHGRSIWK